MRTVTLAAIAASALSAGLGSPQSPPRILAAIFAHADDEVTVGPILARYARDGVKVYLITATDGAQGGANTSVPRGPELARVRDAEARCATEALGIQPPILLGFPDGALGNYVTNPAVLYSLTQRLSEELQRLHPDALITWGPDGGTGHPDHRLVSNIVTQLVRAGAPGVPERLFYASIPMEGFRALNPARGAPPLLIPQAKFFTVRVSFAAADAEAARRSMMCHRTQYSEDVVERVAAAMKQTWNGVLPLAPWFSTTAGTDVFEKDEYLKFRR